MTRARRGLLYRTPQRPPRPRGSLANRPRRTMTRPRRSFTRRTRRTRPSRRASRRPVPSRPRGPGESKPGERRRAGAREEVVSEAPARPASRGARARKERHWSVSSSARRRGTPTDRTRGRVRAASVDEPTVSRRGKKKALAFPVERPPRTRRPVCDLSTSTPRPRAGATRVCRRRSRDAQSARLFADAVRRQETKRAVADAPVPRTRWSGRLPASRLDAGFSRIAGDARGVRGEPRGDRRARPATDRHDAVHRVARRFRGELEPAPVVRRRSAWRTSRSSFTAKPRSAPGTEPSGTSCTSRPLGR